MALLQWNINGYFAHLPELQEIICKIKPRFICLQETRLHPHHKVNLKGFLIYRKDRNNPTNASGGVAILVVDRYHSKEIPIRTDLEAIAISTYVPGMCKVSLCCLYLPPGQNFTCQQLESLINQLPPPFILVTDANCHNVIWGSGHTDRRGSSNA